MQHPLQQAYRLQMEELNCTQRILSVRDNVIGMCPMVWDGALCWPAAKPGETLKIKCPDYVHSFNHSAFATKSCTESGTWFVSSSTNETWTNYSLCVVSPMLPLTNHFEPHIENLLLITKIGYSVSLSTLLIAFIILTCNKRLQCPRNNLHLQLFLSFILRSVLFHVKDIFTTWHFEEFESRMKEFGSRAIAMNTETIRCRIFTVLWHYSLLANYNWILMEGLYLHNLVFFNIFTDNSKIVKYIILGWGLPIFFVVPWAVLRALYEDVNCWNTNLNAYYFWIIRGPITFSIVLNFAFFINITRVLFLKMFGREVAQTQRRYKYSKWFKSTLVLVPLFGVHFTLFLIFELFSIFSPTVEVIWLHVDLFFTSFQGFFVGLLYCFLNGEVQQELRKLWAARNQLPPNSNTCHSIITQSLTYLSRGRSSVLSTGDYIRKESTNKNVLNPSLKTREGILLTPTDCLGNGLVDDNLYYYGQRKPEKLSEAACGSTESVL